MGGYKLIYFQFFLLDYFLLWIICGFPSKYTQAFNHFKLKSIITMDQEKRRQFIHFEFTRFLNNTKTY